MTVEPLLTANEIAEAFNFKRVGWVLEKADPRNADPLPSYRFGEGEKRGPVRFRASEVEAWLRRRSTAARAS